VNGPAASYKTATIKVWALSSQPHWRSNSVGIWYIVHWYAATESEDLLPPFSSQSTVLGPTWTIVAASSTKTFLYTNLLGIITQQTGIFIQMLLHLMIKHKSWQTYWFTLCRTWIQILVHIPAILTKLLGFSLIRQIRGYFLKIRTSFHFLYSLIILSFNAT
jgi:hypothetical protein